MAEDANYEWACQHWDMVNIADWMLLEGYFNNTDVGGNAFTTDSIEVRGITRMGVSKFDAAAMARRTLAGA